MIARARAIDRLRARRARPVVTAEPLVDSVPSEAVPLTDQLVAAEQAARVREALTSLPPEQRIALELAYFEGLTQSEIAERLTTPLGTVKTRMRAALAALRRSLRP